MYFIDHCLVSYSNVRINCFCSKWNAGVGPAKDAYNIGDNPQFLLEVQGKGSGAIWVLLTRHITDIADFRQNKEYITVLIYRNNGKRVYYPRKHT